MPDIATILTALLAAYALLSAIFIVSENRRPQATLAWMLAFFAAPGLGLLFYLLFGRDRKAFSRRRKLLLQELSPHALPVLEPILSRQPDVIARIGRDSLARRRLVTLVQRNSMSAVTARNQAEILQNADVFYPRMIDDIKAARRWVHLQYFIWRSDAFTQELKDVLAEKVREGVEVRVLYDPLGSLVGRSYVKEMRAANVRMEPTSPLWRLHTISYRNHRKITVIDGEIGYTGGMNIGQEHLDGGGAFDFWRDTQLRAVGEVAAILQAVFAVDWYNATKENLFADKYFPAEAVEAIEGDVPIQIVTSGPDSDWAAIRQLYSYMIVTAARHVYIQSPLFVLDAEILAALKAAALAGVDVKVMLNPKSPGDTLANWAGSTYMVDVMQAGVRVFLYEKGYLHAKTISIDSEICSIGSANLDIRSFSINYELNAVIYDPRFASDLEAAFVRDLADCVELSVEEYEGRPALVRLRDSFARLLSPLL